MPDLTTRIGDLTMRSPVMLASGTVGYGPEYEGIIDFAVAGAIVTKTITVEPRVGNAPPHRPRERGAHGVPRRETA